MNIDIADRDGLIQVDNSHGLQEYHLEHIQYKLEQQKLDLKWTGS